MSQTLQIAKATAIHIVDAIEPSLQLWVEQLGWRVVVDVPDGDRLGFVLLQRDSAELMLQTRRSLAGDLPKVAALSPSSILYLDVNDLALAERAVAGAELLVPPRKTFYGAHELFIRDPAGHVIGFSHHPR